MNKQQRGQFFTTNDKVQTVLTRLLHNKGTLLEPSAGAGHLVVAAENTNKFSITAWELDTAIVPTCATPITFGNFFTLADQVVDLFDSVLANPPFVAWREVEQATIDAAKNVKAAYSDKTNLYHLFIDRCIDLVKADGEMVFIVPKEWLYTTSAAPLRTKIMREGFISHFVDCGEEKLFTDADVPAIVIFRWQKTSKTAPVKYADSLDAAFDNKWSERVLTASNSRLMLLPKQTAKDIKAWGVFADCYSVKVGMVSAADNVFRLPAGTQVEDNAVKNYITTKGVEKFIDLNHIKTEAGLPPKAKAYLTQFKPVLLARGIRKFDETNWWQYGAVRNSSLMADILTDRFYAFAKTRNTPFFTTPVTEATFFSGGILGIYSKGTVGGVKPATAVKILNHPNFWFIFDAMFLTTGNKVSFQPATLEDLPFPKTEIEAQNWLKDQK